MWHAPVASRVAEQLKKLGNRIEQKSQEIRKGQENF